MGLLQKPELMRPDDFAYVRRVVKLRRPDLRGQRIDIQHAELTAALAAFRSLPIVERAQRIVDTIDILQPRRSS